MMKKLYPRRQQRKRLPFLLAAIVMAFLPGKKAAAQANAPNLPLKTTLSQTLLSNRSFTNGTAADTVTRLITDPGGYTLEVTAKVNAATGRGLDIEGRNAALNGFRLSLDAANLKNTNPLTAPQTLSAIAAGSYQTIRVAVRNDSAYFYQNGYFMQGQPLAAIKDIAGGVESASIGGTTSSTSLMANWANGSGTPGSNSWAVDGSTMHSIFNTANSGSGARYIDIASPGGAFTNPDGSKFIGRLMYMRWDNDAIVSSVYSFPVTLEANTSYDFSWLYAYNSNASVASRWMTVGIGKNMTTGGRIASKTFYTAGTQAFKRDNFTFTSQEAGTYYLTFTGLRALFAIADLSTKKINIDPRFVLGKNYPSGAVNMDIISATYEAGAWAPTPPVNSDPRQTVTLTGNMVSLPATYNTDFVVPGKTDVHFNGEYTAYGNASIALNSNDSWLFFDNVRPARVLTDYLSTITINGAAAVNNTNVRVAVYKNGTVVIPGGNLTNAAALTVYTQPSQAGTSQSYPIQTIFNNLGHFDNAIRSFMLKRGYIATLANNPNGTGYSRVFIANDSDMVINTMPAGLDTTVSFIRVMKWNWPSKKGKAGWSPDKVGATWYYDWNIAGDNGNVNYDYTGIRQNAGWPDFNAIINKGVNHLSGFNEPDRPDQANISQDVALAQWPELMKTGLRLGSPSPSDPYNSWLRPFLDKAEALNYRVDYVTIHCYWGGLTAQQWYDRLLYIYNLMGKRPLWITEWNNGANWTTESWPSDFASQQQKQLADLKGILQVLDTASFVERYAEYDWVQDKRALVLGDTLTPAGKYYFVSKSDFAYNAGKLYTHNWKLVAAPLSSTIQDTNYFRVKLNWTDINGETGLKYLLERKIDGRDADYVAVLDTAGYAAGSTLSFIDSVYGKATYRVKAFSRDGAAYVYSTTLDVVRDAAPVATASLTGTIVSATRAKLSWTTAATARYYNLKRADNANGPWTTVATLTAALSYTDTTLAPATTYYYAVTTLNNAGESNNSTVVTMTTPALTAPAAVLAPRIASGDGKVILTWDFQYDVNYAVIRSATENGTWDTIASGLSKLRFADNNRPNDVAFYYKVIAYNEKGFAVSNTMMAKPNWGRQAFVSFNDTATALAEDIWGGYHAVFASAATRDTTRAGTGLKLDGSANAYATLGEGVVSGLNDFTISTWYKPAALSTWMRLWDFGNSTSQYMFLTPQAGTSNGASIVRYGIKNGGAESLLSYNYAFPLNSWTHLVIAQRDSVVQLYINGNLVTSATNFYLRPADLGITTRNYIGKSQYPDPMLRGVVDELQIFNYALSDADVLSLYNGNPVILPIILSSFTGKPTPQGNLLNWKVNTSSASIQMTLERSSDSRNFSPVYTTTATRTATQQPFSYTDAPATAAISYYRLKLTDVDGKVTYSPVVAIAVAVKGLQLAGFHPTVVNSTAYASIQSDKAASIKLVITDMNGRMVQLSSRSVAAGSNLLIVDAATLVNGTYTISVLSENQQMGSIRFVVRH